MTEAQKAAVINARCACAMARIMGMHAENMQRQQDGQPMAYTGKEFAKIIIEEQIRRDMVRRLLSK